MRLSQPFLALALATLAAAGPLACSSSTHGSSSEGGAGDASALEAGADGEFEGAVEGAVEGGGDAGGDGPSLGDVAPEGDDGSEAQVPTVPDATVASTAYMRVANWAPDAPAVDFCISPHGMNSYTGPVVGAQGAEDDAGAGGLAFPAVSAYLPMAPGRYDVRAVVGGGGNCSAGVAPDVTTLPAIGAAAFMTVALLGEDVPSGGDPGLQFAAFADDFVPHAGPVLRFINASPKLARVDFGTESTSGKLTALFSAVPFGEASAASEAPHRFGDASLVVDTNGYAAAVFSAVTLSARAPGTSTDVAVSMGMGGLGFATPGSVVVTIVLVGGTSAGIAAHFLECADSAGTVGPLGDCALLP
jgi:hypothetical protein